MVNLLKGRMPEDKPLLVLTGATGFVGKTLQGLILEAGFNPRALVRKEISDNPHLLNSTQQVCVNLVPENSEQEKKLSEALTDANAVIYCAGSVRGACLDDFLDANQKGLASIVKRLEALPEPPPLLLISSMAASRPEISDYANSKNLGEAVLSKSSNIPWTIIRPTAIYGPGDKEMQPLFDLGKRGILPVLGPKEQRISLLHVDDVGHAAIAWLEAWKNCHHATYTLDDGTPGGYTWPVIGEIILRAFQLANKNMPNIISKVRLVRIPHWTLNVFAHINRTCAKLVGYAPMLTPGKVNELTQKQWLGDNSEFTKATGWKPRIGLEAGLEAMYSYN